MKHALALLLFSVILVFMQACSKNSDTKQTPQDENLFRFTTLQGKPLLIEKYAKGYRLKNEPHTVLILDIFATWCPPCQAEAAVLSDLAQKYGKAIRIVGISVEENVSPQKLAAYAEQFGVTYTLVQATDTKRFLRDFTQTLRIGERFAIPLVAIFHEGALINHYLGATEEEFIQSDLKQIIGK